MLTNLVLDYSVLPAFIIASLAITLAPGPDTFLLLRNTLRGGIREGFITMAGIFTGITILTVFMVSGIGLVVAQNDFALTALKFVGALYLAYLGLLGAIAARKLIRTHKAQTLEEGVGEIPVTLKTRPYLVGMFTNLTNPKVLVFFVAFFPQFLGTTEAPTLQLLFLSLLFMAMSAIYEVVLILAAASMRQLLTSAIFNIWIEISVAVIFLGLAVGLIISGLGPL